MAGKSKPNFGWKFFIVSILLIATILLSLILIKAVQIQKVEISNLNSKIDMILNSVRQNNLSVKNSEISLQPYYSAISDKMDNTISEIITLVTIIMGISTASGLILAFKAPRDIENEINNAKSVALEAKQAANEAILAAASAKAAAEDLNILVENSSIELNEKVQAAEKSSDEANKAAKDAKKDALQVKFEAELNDAINKDTKQQKMEALLKLEKKHPKEKKVFVHKGRISSNAEDAKNAFDEARKLGLKDPDYYNELARIYYILDDYNAAIEMIKKALEIEKACWLYINFARTLCSKAECDISNKEYNLSILKEALGYLSEAEAIDQKEQNIYLLRARIYSNINEHYKSDMNYEGDYIAAIDKAYDIDPELAHEYFAKMEFDICKGKENYKDNRTLTGLAFVQLAKNDCQHCDFVSAFDNTREAYYALYLPIQRNTTYRNIAANAASIIPMFNHSDLQRSLGLISGEKEKAFLDSIQVAAVDLYERGKQYEAGKVFAYLYVAYGKNTNKDNTIVCLIYMMRRNEIKTTRKNIDSLISQVSNSSSVFAQVNIYLWNVQNARDEEGKKLAYKVFNCYEFIRKDIDAAQVWWANIGLVGEDESIVVLELLSKMRNKILASETN